MKRVLFFLVCITGLLCLLAAPAFAGPKTIYVPPSNKDDTAAIQNA